MTKPYPLEAALAQRQAAVDQATLELATTLARLDELETVVRRQRSLLREHQQRTREWQAAEAAGYARGAADLQRAQAYRLRREAEASGLERDLADAERSVTEQEGRVAGARARVAESRAEREAVERHRAKWQASEDRVAARKLESEVDDLIASRHSGG